jgi:hypothetical protein
MRGGPRTAYGPKFDLRRRQPRNNYTGRALQYLCKQLNERRLRATAIICNLIKAQFPYLTNNNTCKLDDITKPRYSACGFDVIRRVPLLGKVLLVLNVGVSVLAPRLCQGRSQMPIPAPKWAGDADIGATLCWLYIAYPCSILVGHSRSTGSNSFGTACGESL